MFRILFCSLQFNNSSRLPIWGSLEKSLREKHGEANATGFTASSLVACSQHGYGPSLTFWGKLMHSVVLQVTGCNLSMGLEVTLPPYMDTVNLTLNTLRLEQFYFHRYGAKRYPVCSQPILTHSTLNFFHKNRRDLDFHEHLLSRNFN